MELNLAWFIGFAPVKNPEVAIAVLVEGVIPQDHIQGGLTATPWQKISYPRILPNTVNASHHQ